MFYDNYFLINYIYNIYNIIIIKMAKKQVIRRKTTKRTKRGIRGGSLSFSMVEGTPQLGAAAYAGQAITSPQIPAPGGGVVTNPSNYTGAGGSRKSRKSRKSRSSRRRR
jgi:hypothetical protein